ncbi:hypothetical protein [Niabella ginsengisoli]|uniref:DUF4134 domain-containing protein n=1 Tax=Niabella ginsengisoli TaxID=522298 RepID=A0ABS9SME1_9BACT|nr:hypothetical protein [Niabella ginsengisoli]MCH5599529.1 hypothetical protein [Niabella ginsengisoli]
MKTKQLLNLVIGIMSSYVAQAQNSNNIAYRSQFQRDFVTVKTVNNQAGIFNTDANATFNYNEEKYRKFKKMRTAGIVLTSVGAGLIIGGSALIAAGNNENDGRNFEGDFDDDYYYDDLTDGDSKIVAGVLGIAFGALSTGGGITMWVIGNNKMKKYGGGQMSLQPTRNGLGLAYRF